MGHRLPLRRAIGALKGLQGHAGAVSTRKAAAIPAPLVWNASLRHPRSLLFLRFHSSQPKRASLQEDDEEMFSISGLKVRYSSDMKFIPESLDEALPCYRLLCSNGELCDPSSAIELGKEVCLQMYRKMVALQIMDTILYDAQRQGRISFYITATGKEAISIASAAALHDIDVVFLQYREPGVLMWRGFTLQQFADQCFGNEADLGKGRQMPVHYGCNKLKCLTVSSPIATQIPQAVGAAYALKMDKADACAVTYFGDGATSQGDFHAAMNFAAVLDAPMLLICRNNGYAISTPTSEQFRSTLQKPVSHHCSMQTSLDVAILRARSA